MREKTHNNRISPLQARGARPNRDKRAGCAARRQQFSSHPWSDHVCVCVSTTAPSARTRHEVSCPQLDKHRPINLVVEIFDEQFDRVDTWDEEDFAPCYGVGAAMFCRNTKQAKQHDDSTPSRPPAASVFRAEQIPSVCWCSRGLQQKSGKRHILQYLISHSLLVYTTIHFS